MIDFNIPLFFESSLVHIQEAIKNKKICGDGEFTQRVEEWIKLRTQAESVLLTTSCTHATEMAALLIDIKEGDEVIMPSYTFVSTANAFVMRGAKIVFVDIRPDTMNIDEKQIEEAITDKTRAIVPVHYAGVACEMDTITDIARKHSLYVIEDAAQALLSTYKGKALGSIGDLGCFSFHETKNFNMGEGGALLIQRPEFIREAEIIWEKGTDRSAFFRGEVDKYSWVGKGSSYLPSELNAAYLYSQLEHADAVNNKRKEIWNNYKKGLKDLADDGLVELPYIPPECTHNGHLFYVKVKDLNERTKLIDYLKQNGIQAVFHYLPLHTSKAGHKYARFSGEDQYTTKESERLVRLPLYYDLSESNQAYVIEKIHDFFGR